MPVDVFEYMYLKGGVQDGTVFVIMPCDCGVVILFNVIKVCAKSFDNRVFCFSNIDARYFTNVAGDRIYQIAALTIGFGDRAGCAILVGICDGPCVAYFGTIPAGFLSVARLWFFLWFLGVTRGGHFSPNQFVLSIWTISVPEHYFSV